MKPITFHTDNLQLVYQNAVTTEIQSRRIRDILLHVILPKWCTRRPQAGPSAIFSDAARSGDTPADPETDLEKNTCEENSNLVEQTEEDSETNTFVDYCDGEKVIPVGNGECFHSLEIEYVDGMSKIALNLPITNQSIKGEYVMFKSIYVLVTEKCEYIPV